MWNELESYKNHFLQKSLPYMTAERINQLEQENFKAIQAKSKTCRAPYPEVCEHSTYFNDRAQLAYGFYALPKLMHEISSDVPLIKWRAINSLSEFLLNPLQAQRAILEKDIVRKTQNIFIRIQHHYQKKYYREPEQLMQIFQRFSYMNPFHLFRNIIPVLLSQYYDGAMDISHRPNLIKEFYRIIYIKQSLMYVATKILRNLTEKYAVLLHLLQNTNALNEVAKIFNHDICIPYHPEALWVHLSHFLELDPETGIKKGFFDLFYNRIMGRLPLYHTLNMKCFGLLLRCEEGQRRFDAIDGVLMLHTILSNEQLDTFEFVVFALYQGMISRHALWRCRELTDLPGKLIQLAKETDNTRLQLHCVKALRLMSDMPCVKNFIRTACLEELMSFKCLNEFNECARDDFALWLNREIYDSSELGTMS